MQLQVISIRRYLASEGFLPGYNFPRLPLSAYIPGQRGSSDDFLSRPRFLAIAEFGPNAIIYHEGATYQVDRITLPMREDGEAVPLDKAALCGKCGYMHISEGAPLTAVFRVMRFWGSDVS